MKKIKIPFWLETQVNKIIQPNIVTIVETFIDGKRSRKFYGKSLTGNFLQWIYAMANANDANFLVSDANFFNSRTAGIRADTGAASSSLATNISIEAAAGVSNQGIRLGSAVVVPAPASYNIGTLIANGVGAGQLVYNAMGSIQGCTVVGSQTSFILQRTFNNNSGGNVTVQAIAIQSNDVVGGLQYYLDAVAPADVIGNGQVYTVQITFQITT